MNDMNEKEREKGKKKIKEVYFLHSSVPFSVLVIFIFLIFIVRCGPPG